MYLGFPVCPVPVSIECAETHKKENKTLAGRSQGRRKRYWRGTGGYLGFPVCPVPGGKGPGQRTLSQGQDVVTDPQEAKQVVDVHPQ